MALIRQRHTQSGQQKTRDRGSITHRMRAVRDIDCEPCPQCSIPETRFRVRFFSGGHYEAAGLHRCSYWWRQGQRGAAKADEIK
jgi:hypothetical protein